MKRISERYKNGRILLAAVLLLLALLLITPQQPAGAAVLLVTKIGDTDDGACDADCSLREAVGAAANGDVIRFSVDLVNEEIVLNGEEILIDNSISIEGLGPTRLTISGNDQSRIFTIDENANVEISGLTLHEGYVLVNLPSVGRPSEGGGAILNRGTLTLDQMLITDNRVVDGGGSGIGGGIHSQDATLTVNNSTISNNVVEDVTRGCLGGGISSAGNLTLFNVTISGNEALDAGGYCFGAGLNIEADDLSALDNLSLTFVTIAGNRAIEAQTDGFVTGGGISSGYQAGAAAITVRNLLIAGNIPENCDPLFFTTAGGYNLDDDGSCEFSDATDLSVQDAVIGLLQDNGGPVPTHALLENSPAIDRIPINNSGCQAGQTTDARSAVRADGDDRGGPACDIGAFEYDSLQQPTALTFLSVQGEQSGLPLWTAGALLLVLALGLLVWKRRAAG